MKDILMQRVDKICYNDFKLKKFDIMKYHYRRIRISIKNKIIIDYVLKYIVGTDKKKRIL